MASDDYWQLQDPGWMRRHYVEQDLRLVDIVAMVGCTDGELRSQLRRYEIRKQADVSAITEEFLEREYVGRRRPALDIATEVGCHVGVILRRLDEFGIDQHDHPRRPAEFAALDDVEWLEAQMAGGRSQREIADEIGCSRSAVGMALLRARAQA